MNPAPPVPRTLQLALAGVREGPKEGEEMDVARRGDTPRIEVDLGLRAEDEDPILRVTDRGNLVGDVAHHLEGIAGIHMSHRFVR